MTKRPFTSGIEVFDVVACSFLFGIEIALVFSVPLRGYKIEKNAKHSKWDAREKRNEEQNRRGIHKIVNEKA